MDTATLDRIRASLTEERDRLETEVDTLDREGYEALSEASGENNYRDHMADQGSATFSRELDMTLEGNVREALGAVRNSLLRIDEGTYGICERCGSQIGVDRLEAMPTATLCITCKSAEESL
jgi:DnaK suppressor protein